MNLGELKSWIDRELQLKPRNAENRVVIPLHIPGSVGGRPFVEVHRAYSGNDWDKNNFFLFSDEKLVIADVTSEQLRNLEIKYGELDYDKRGLEAEVRRLKRLLNKEYK